MDGCKLFERDGLPTPTNQPNQPTNPTKPNQPTNPTNQSNQYTNQSIPTRERRRLVLVVEGAAMVGAVLCSFVLVVVVAWLVAVLLSYLSLSCGPSSGG